MFRKIAAATAAVLIVVAFVSCRKKTGAGAQPGAKYAVTLMTLDPGHFHSALVQKTMYADVSPVVSVYAPAGPELDEHLKRIASYNGRADSPTTWEEKVYTGPDFLEKMLAEKPGNVVVISGNNSRKAEYIKGCVDGGLNVFADKPMCIDMAGFDLLEEALDVAARKGSLVYDIMTERSEVTTILQKELMNAKEVFGGLSSGTADEPAVVKESVHHFFKYVSGSPLKRPPWFFDTAQQGEGIVDVTTHLLDLVMWECFPDHPVDYHTDVEVVRARRWPTLITREQFRKATGLDDFPDYLKGKLDAEGRLVCYCNGEIVCKIRGVFSRVSVVWNFEAASGAGDTHYSTVRGAKAAVVIRQGPEQNYRPELYVEPTTGGAEFEMALINTIVKLQETYPGVRFEPEKGIWRFIIPDEFRAGHEAHFAEVMHRFLRYLQGQDMPPWETSNMRAKYYITTKALEMATKEGAQ